MYFQIKRENKVMIILVMQLLKMEVQDKEDLEILIFQDLFQIFLKTFLVTFQEEGEEVKRSSNFRGADLRYDLIY